jgi:GH18 family chitinase
LDLFQGSATFAKCLGTAKLRVNFSFSANDVMMNLGFDGIEIDWVIITTLNTPYVKHN